MDRQITSPDLSVHVLATTPGGTRSALAVAKRMTEGCGARIVLLVPRLTSLPAPFDPSSRERLTIIDEHRAVATDVGVDVTLLFCVCQRIDDVVHQMLGPSSLVIVGGRHRAGWPGSEQRLVRRLTAEGYAVVFAQVGSEERRGEVGTARRDHEVSGA